MKKDFVFVYWHLKIKWDYWGKEGKLKLTLNMLTESEPFPQREVKKGNMDCYIWVFVWIYVVKFLATFRLILVWL